MPDSIFIIILSLFALASVLTVLKLQNRSLMQIAKAETKKSHNLEKDSAEYISKENLMDIYPGKIFKKALDIRTFIRRSENKDNPSLITYAIDRFRHDMKYISNIRINNYIATEMGYDDKVVVDDKGEIIIKNIAICLRTFWKQVQSENGNVKISNRYIKGIEQIIWALNSLYSEKRINYQEFLFQIYQAKSNVYFSLYPGLNFSQEKSKEFIKDVSVNPDMILDRSNLKKFIGLLSGKWAKNPQNIRALKPNFVVPLFTLINLLKYYEVNYNNSKKGLEELAEILTKFEHERIISIGLEFDKEHPPVDLTRRVRDNSTENTADVMYEPLASIVTFGLQGKGFNTEKTTIDILNALAMVSQ